MSDIRNQVREWGPAWLYGVSIVVGATVIWVGKLYDANIYVVTGVPVFLMLLYAAVNAGLPGLRVRNEQTGDNLYYMGFVFTLMSLGISLFKFTGEASIEDIVRNFGIAIISTVSGILLRIMFNQMRRDPADIERAIRTELAELTRKVRTELDSSALEFSSYRRTSNQMLSEGFEEIARQAEKNGEAVRSAIEAMSLKATQTLQETADRLVATLDETHRQVSEIAERNVAMAASMTERLEGAIEKVIVRAAGLSDAMDKVTEKYSKARSPEEVLELNVAPAVEALRMVVDANVKALNEHAAGARDATKKVLAAIGPFKQTAANLNQLAGRIELANDASGRSTAAMGEVLGLISESVKATSDATTAHEKSQVQIAQLIENVSTAAASSQQAEELTRQQAREQAARFEDSLANFTTIARAIETETQHMRASEGGAISLEGIQPHATATNMTSLDQIHEELAVTETPAANEERNRWSLFSR